MAKFLAKPVHVDADLDVAVDVLENVVRVFVMSINDAAGADEIRDPCSYERTEEGSGWKIVATAPDGEDLPVATLWVEPAAHSGVQLCGSLETDNEDLEAGAVEQMLHPALASAVVSLRYRQSAEQLVAATGEIIVPGTPNVVAEAIQIYCESVAAQTGRAMGGQAPPVVRDGDMVVLNAGGSTDILRFDLGRLSTESRTQTIGVVVLAPPGDKETLDSATQNIGEKVTTIATSLSQPNLDLGL